MDVVALTIPVSVEDVAQAVRESGHRCFPVVNGTLDDVVGVLYVNDLFRSRRPVRPGLLGEPGGGSAGPAGPGSGPVGSPLEGVSTLEISRRIRHAYVIPESRRILDALVEMRHQRRTFAIVVDEYGGVSGVLTVKDLLEPIVGDLHDEFDADDEPAIVRVDGSRWLIDGRVNVDEVRDRLGIEVPEGDYVTLGGYLFDGFGRIPDEGESLVTDGWELTVQEMDKRRVAQVVARMRSADELAAATVDDPQGTADPQSHRQIAKVVPGTDSRPSQLAPDVTGAAREPDEPRTRPAAAGADGGETAAGGSTASDGPGAMAVNGARRTPSGPPRRRG